MKNIISLLAIIIIIVSQDIACNDSILSKFRQHTYKLKDVRMQLMSYDKNYINFYKIVVFKYNRTTTAHNVTINAKVNFEDKIEVIVQHYKFLSNEYRPIAVRFQVNAQKAFVANVIGLHEMVKCGNMTSFRFYKDITYHFCNFVIDETKFPPLIPNGIYMLEFTFLFLNKEVAVVHLYHEIYTPMAYPKS